MPFWMQTEDPEYYTEEPYNEVEELEDTDNVLTDDVTYFGA